MSAMDETGAGIVETGHTPEPWGTVPPNMSTADVRAVWGADGKHIATFHDSEARRRAGARRKPPNHLPTQQL